MAAHATTNHDEIRRWAESKGGKPAAVARTHRDGDVGIIRIMFPNAPQSEHDQLVEISWDEFFDQFEKSKLALIYEDDSLFNKIVGRDTLERREEGEEHASRHHPGRHDSHRGDRSEHSGGEESRGNESRASQSGGEAKSAQGGKQSSSDDLASREYRDSEGNIHHHTRTYERDHGKQ